MTWAGKTVVVTGGNSGIGRGIASHFMLEGATAVVIGRDAAKGDETVASLTKETGGTVEFHACDLAGEEAVKALASTLIEKHGKIDVLVNNAGVGARRSGVEHDDSPGVRWQKLRGPNLDSTYFMTAYLAKALPDDSGAVVNISSTATLHGNWGLYCAAKAGVEGLTRAFAAEFAPRNIRVNGVSPGWIDSGTVNASYASGSESGGWTVPPSLFNRMGSVSEIASAVLFLASDGASFITGQTLIVDGGLSITECPSIPVLEKVGWKLRSAD
ncbi:MAG: SDR family oxidoreductase [Alphaproteobacteria bacterium]